VAKQYKDMTPQEKYDSAIAADKEPWDPVQTAKDLIKEKLGTKDVSKAMPSIMKPMVDKMSESDANVAKGIEIKAGKVEKDKPYKLNPVAKKAGGKVKCMSKGGMTASKRADGIATKGKTRGRII